MDWYDTAGDSWLHTAFGDVNVDSYHDVVPADDPVWLETASSAVDLGPTVIDGTDTPIDTPAWTAAPWADPIPEPEVLPAFWAAPDDTLGGSVWTLPSPW